MTLFRSARNVWRVATLLLVCGGAIAQNQSATSGGNGRTPVLVELFTSEGCSTCPPADDLLTELVRRQPVPGVLVVGIGEHVDYWNQLGWTDRFSSGAYSLRQRVYAKSMKSTEVYTPQMVIGGSRQALGSDRTAVVHAITAAAKEPTAVLTLSQLEKSGGSMRFTVSMSGAAVDGPDLYATLIDDSDSTMVTGGENGGHSLQYTNTSRGIKIYGPINNGQSKTLEIPLPPDAGKKKMQLVVFAQQPGQGRIVAVAASAI